jgi:galacturonosyltransferase
MEAVREGESGLLCTAKDTDSLYDAMKTMLHTPREQREAMGLSGRRLMEERFEKQKVVAQTVRAMRL